MKINGIILLLTMFFISAGAHAVANAEVQTVVVKSSQNKVLSKKNLDAIKRFILKTGQTCTYSNMYNDNPCYQTAHYQFYLNPDPGGPHNHPQWNINCDPKKGDFNSLVIETNMKPVVPDVTTYLANTTVQFFSNNVEIKFYNKVNKVQSQVAIKTAQLAVAELLLQIKKRNK
jgi:hypothetical protein